MTPDRSLAEELEFAFALAERSAERSVSLTSQPSCRCRQGPTRRRVEYRPGLMNPTSLITNGAIDTDLAELLGTG